VRTRKWFIRISALAVLVMLALLPGSGQSRSLAAPERSGPTQLTFQQTANDPTTWTVGTLLQAKPGIPFNWLRAAPSSFAFPIDYAPNGDTLTVVSKKPQWDGVQFWWQVRRARGMVMGYVEQAFVGPVAQDSLTLTPISTAVGGVGGPASTPPEAWQVGSVRAVKASIPFVWVRTTPSSDSPTRATILRGWLAIIQDPAPRWDGLQWWWMVRIPAFNTVGWVEQNSLF